MIDLDRIERLARKATPGPWRASRHDEGIVAGPKERMFHAGKDLFNRGPEWVSPDDRRYVAAVSPDVVLELIRELRDAREKAREGVE